MHPVTLQKQYFNGFASVFNKRVQWSSKIPATETQKIHRIAQFDSILVYDSFVSEFSGAKLPGKAGEEEVGREV